MDTTKTITHIGLCAGYGGIELGLARVLPTLRSVALCEIEAFPIANLVAKMEAGLMESAPIWTDLKTLPWESFRDRVDILTGGYPCQPFSAAGKRAGKEDPRHLWPWIADGIRVLRPRFCFLENVEGHISLGLSSVISDLEELGYKVSWGIFSASEVGAPHQRKRVFILAHHRSKGLEGLRECCDSQGWEAQIGYAGSSGDVWPSELANASSDGYDWRELQDRVEGWASGELPQSHEGESCGVWSEASRCGQAWPSRPGEQQHGWEPPRVVGNAEQFLFPASREHAAMDEASGISTDRERSKPSQTDPITGSSRKREGDGSNASECCQAQPPLGGNPDGTSGGMGYAELYTTCDNRTDELRLLGNGVVPATAERAFRTLIKELL